LGNKKQKKSKEFDKSKASAKPKKKNRYHWLKADVLAHYKLPAAELDQFLVTYPALIEMIEGIPYITIGKKIFRNWIKNRAKDPGFDSLHNAALQAEYRAKISKAELKDIETEKAKMKLLQDREELIERDVAKHFYISYLELLTKEIFFIGKKLGSRLDKRLSSVLNSEERQQFRVEFEKEFDNEIEAVIISVKAQQEKDLKNALESK